VISTDRIGSYKSNNHTITATTVPSCILRLHVHVPNRTIVHAPNNQHSLLIVFDVVRATHFVNSLCCVFVMFVFVFCLVSVSLHCIFLIAHSVFCAISNFLTIQHFEKLDAI
jgi:hypothetical protein